LGKIKNICKGVGCAGKRGKHSLQESIGAYLGEGRAGVEEKNTAPSNKRSPIGENRDLNIVVSSDPS